MSNSTANVSTTPGSILKFSTFSDVDKAYTVRLVSGIIFGIIAGFVTGNIYEIGNIRPVNLTGWAIFWFQSLGSALFIKVRYDLKNWTNLKIFRHAVMMNLFNYIFFWVLIYNFIVVPQIL